MFHGIASILPFQVPVCLPYGNDAAVKEMPMGSDCLQLSEEQMKDMKDRLKGQRLNLNVRKVRRDGATFLDLPH